MRVYGGWQCPDKDPSTRLAALQSAGEAQVPFTSGILIGLGETTSQRLDALIHLRKISNKYGNLQEVIIALKTTSCA